MAGKKFQQDSRLECPPSLSQKQINWLDLLIETFRCRADLMDMLTTTMAITAESFEKVFVRSATKKSGPHATTKQRLDWTDWRDIARKALHNKELGHALRNAVLPLPAKYREVLFLQDVKNLDTEETAWILGIAGGAVKAWLSRARTLVRKALTSALSPRLSSKCSNLAGFYRGLKDSGSELVAILR